MDDVLVVGAGPAGLLAAWVARQRGATVRLVAAGIGTTHISPGWIGVLNAEGDLDAALAQWSASHPQHPYAVAGVDALSGGIAALSNALEGSDLHYTGDLTANLKLPTALGAVTQAALVPESFAAGDLRRPGALLIAGPGGWRDFYPSLCAANLMRQGIAAASTTFDLPGSPAGKFDHTPLELARRFDRPEVRASVAAHLKPRLGGFSRVGMPAILGLETSRQAWLELQDRLGMPVFEIPTLPPSVPGVRLYDAMKRRLLASGVRVALDMTATRGLFDGDRLAGLVVPNVVREAVYRANSVILATGGLYGGGITSDYRGDLREVILGLPVSCPVPFDEWCRPRWEDGHPIHEAGIRANNQLQPVDLQGRVVLENVHIAGRLLAGYNPSTEGSTEGVWLATAYRAALEATNGQ